MQSSTSKHFQALLLAGICGIAALQTPPCPRLRPNETCGCDKFESLPCLAADGWSWEDSEYYYLDDMAFRKQRPAMSMSDPAQPKLVVNPAFWPGGLIFYVIDESFESSFRNEILAAMTTIQTSVGEQHLEFRSARTAKGAICRKTHLLVERTDYKICAAEVGMTQGGRTVSKMWLNQLLCPQGTIQHELLHALGRLHEMARPDRDQHVTLLPREILRKECSNFEKMCRTVAEDPSLRLPYDSNSIMHYGSCFFTCTGRHTILARGGVEIAANRAKMTVLDIEKMRLMYPASAKMPYSDGPCGCGARHRSFVGVLLGVTFHVVMRLVW